MRTWALMVMTLIGCFDLGSLQDKCDPAAPRCLPGYQCLDGFCRRTASGFDGSENPTVDLASAPDLSAPDMATNGCSRVPGIRLGVAHACPGLFPMGEARLQCATGWKICTDATGIDQLAIIDAPPPRPFFVADALTWGTQSAPCGMDCAVMNPPTWPGFAGVGGPNAASDGYACNYNVRPCSGFKSNLDCGNATTQSKWTCRKDGPMTVDDLANHMPMDGVLCCPR